MEFLLHCCDYIHLHLIAHFRILKPGEPLAHQFREFPAVQQLRIIHAAVKDRATVNTCKRSPEHFSLRCFASVTLLFVVLAPTAQISADGLDFLLCHTLRSQIRVIYGSGLKGESGKRYRNRCRCPRPQSTQIPVFQPLGYHDFGCIFLPDFRVSSPPGARLFGCDKEGLFLSSPSAPQGISS